MNLKQYFDRVVLINLKRRRDRLLKVRRELRECQWPFRTPEIFAAVDGRASPPPPSWHNGAGAWGCLQSHRLVLEQAVADGVKKLLVLEDDVCFAGDFLPGIKKFLRSVPSDWDQLMIGGQHYNVHGKPTLVKPGIFRCTDCERRHCYAIRGEFMQKLSARWRSGGKFDGNTFGDKIMGRDPEMQLAHKVYAPRFFLAGQERSYSDIYGAVVPRRFWNPPDADLFVINLHAPPAVATALRDYGLNSGQGAGSDGNLHVELARIFAETENDPVGRKHRLGNWIKIMQWELGADQFLFCTVAHPEADPEVVKAASLWKVHEVTAESVQAALAQLPPRIRTALLAAHRGLKKWRR